MNKQELIKIIEEFVIEGKDIEYIKISGWGTIDVSYVTKIGDNPKCENSNETAVMDPTPVEVVPVTSPVADTPVVATPVVETPVAATPAPAPVVETPAPVAETPVATPVVETPAPAVEAAAPAAPATEIAGTKSVAQWFGGM